MQKINSPYEISNGTLREEDLIPTFLIELELLEHPRAQQLQRTWDYLTSKLRRIQEGSYRGKMTQSDIQEVLSCLLWEEIVDALDECSGDGLEFGAHPGDGSCFGWWPVEEED